jgi:dienelactone hydrolase
VAEVVLFHHVQGLTPGVEALAESLRAGRHTVHVPDLYDGRTFDSIESGFGYVTEVGQAVLEQRARAAVADLPSALVYAGISLGVGAAQEMAQTRPGARGALLYEACLPITGEWAVGPWPAALPAQVHGMDADPFFALEGDIDAAREIVASAPDLVELFTYPGDRHLFTDASLPSYDADATALVVERSLRLLDLVG